MSFGSIKVDTVLQHWTTLQQCRDLHEGLVMRLCRLSFVSTLLQFSGIKVLCSNVICAYRLWLQALSRCCECSSAICWVCVNIFTTYPIEPTVVRCWCSMHCALVCIAPLLEGVIQACNLLDGLFIQTCIIMNMCDLKSGRCASCFRQAKQPLSVISRCHAGARKTQLPINSRELLQTSLRI